MDGPNGASLTTGVPALVTAHRRLWLSGRSGVGKSSCLGHLMRRFCESPSIFAAFRAHRFIPIYLRLRDLGTIPIMEMVQASLQADGMKIKDLHLLEAFIDTGDFLLLFDGMNETDLDEQFPLFLIAHPRAQIVACSQSLLSPDNLGQYSIRPFDRDVAQQLFVALRGDAAVELVPEATWSEIRSGYDVKLLGDLVDLEVSIPGDRIGLYKALVVQAYAQSESSSLQSVRRRAFELWQGRQRGVVVDSTLTKEDVEPGRTAGVLVLRSGRYEFPHDLMRAFMAAFYLADDIGSGQAIAAALASEATWVVPRADQRLMFDFLVRQLEEQALEALNTFAIEAVWSRASLLEALVEEQKRRGRERLTVALAG
jgi:hypothetical protein